MDTVSKHRSGYLKIGTWVKQVVSSAPWISQIDVKMKINTSAAKHSHSTHQRTYKRENKRTFFHGHIFHPLFHHSGIFGRSLFLFCRQHQIFLEKKTLADGYQNTFLYVKKSSNLSSRWQVWSFLSEQQLLEIRMQFRWCTLGLWWWWWWWWRYGVCVCLCVRATFLSRSCRGFLLCNLCMWERRNNYFFTFSLKQVLWMCKHQVTQLLPAFLGSGLTFCFVSTLDSLSAAGVLSKKKSHTHLVVCSRFCSYLPIRAKILQIHDKLKLMRPKKGSHTLFCWLCFDFQFCGLRSNCGQ